jgi:uncharacterized protein YqhQ
MIYTEDSPDSKINWKNLSVVLKFTFKNVFKFFAAILALFVLLVSIVLIIVTPWRLKTNYRELKKIKEDKWEEVEDESSFLEIFLLPVVGKLSFNFMIDLLVVVLSPLILSGFWKYN